MKSLGNGAAMNAFLHQIGSSPYVRGASRCALLLSSLLTVGTVAQSTFELPWWHPTLQNIAVKRIPGPATHTLLDNNAKLQNFILRHTDEEHDFFDGPDGQIQNPEGLDSDHPNIDRYFVPAQRPIDLEERISFFHPDVVESYQAGIAISDTHPSVHDMFAAKMPPSHPNLDELLKDPKSHPLPWWHPKLSLFVSKREVDIELVSISSYHPDVDAAYEAGEAVSDNHPSIQTFLEPILPSKHPNVDDLLRNPQENPLPAGHPQLSDFVTRRSREELPTVDVFHFHPNVATSYEKGIAISSDHPSVQNLLADGIPENHPDIDEMLRDPQSHPLPDWHPALNDFVLKRAPIEFETKVSAYHPDVDLSYKEGTPISSDHPSVQTLFDFVLPASHPNVDELLRDPSNNPLPDWHPPLGRYVVRGPNPLGDGSWDKVSIFFGHPDVEKLYQEGEELPDGHPSVHKMVEDILPARHPDVDVILQSPRDYPLPDWHPPLNSMFVYQSFWSPGLIFALILAAALAITCLFRLVNKVKAHCFRAHSTNTENKDDDNLPNCGNKDGFDDSFNIKEETTRTNNQLHPALVYDITPNESNRLPHRRWQMHKMAKLNVSHRSEYPSYEYEHVGSDVPQTQVSADIQEKTAGVFWTIWRRVTGTRIPRTQWTTGNLLFCGGYILANVAALFSRPGYGVDRGLGSLAAANVIFVVVPATRNSILTWFLGLPFDHVILYHRFIGRVMVAVAFLHFCWYFDRLLDHASEKVYWTGLAALGCALGIVVTTTNWIRRNHFNVFFWSHYLFVGFFAFTYFHVTQAQPFLLTSLIIYGLDKFLRCVWTLLPQRTYVFQNRGDHTAQVKFKKNPLTKLMGRHNVGQYMFLNFPELSLTEWHPFSVSSGPNEDYVEFHIRTLGDHTNDIVALSKQRAESGKTTWIRSDGPYGYLNFNYRRYGILLMVGGGIGITPIISLLRDIYGTNRSEKPHCIRTVYVVWVMPHASEAALFHDVLHEMCLMSESDPTLPRLDISIHCTRAKEGETLGGNVIIERPSFPSIFDRTVDENPASATLVFACGPGRMINELWDESNQRNRANNRVDFHHETFEF